MESINQRMIMKASSDKRDVSKGKSKPRSLSTFTGLHLFTKKNKQKNCTFCLDVWLFIHFIGNVQASRLPPRPL